MLYRWTRASVEVPSAYLILKGNGLRLEVKLGGARHFHLGWGGLTPRYLGFPPPVVPL